MLQEIIVNDVLVVPKDGVACGSVTEAQAKVKSKRRWKVRRAFLAAVLLVSSSIVYSQTDEKKDAAKETTQVQSDKPCAILKRMGPADQVTSRMYSFGIRGKQFQFAEGSLPKGVKFHGRLTDHDVRKIQDAGGKVLIVGAHYTDQEIENARKTCK